MKQECKDCNKSLDDCTCIEDTIDFPKQETLEEVLGSSMCQFSVIENKLAILYRNQVKIYDAITKEQQSYSEEEVYNLILKAIKDCYDEQLEHHYAGDYRNLKIWFEQFKKK